MKRIIKFRAYTEISNEVLGMKYDVPHNFNETVMQFTGLLDRQGKEIYEGDIVRLMERGGYIYATGNIEFRSGSYYLQRGSEDDLHFPTPPYAELFEVIGNIYENPELLTPKK